MAEVRLEPMPFVFLVCAALSYLPCKIGVFLGAGHTQNHLSPGPPVPECLSGQEPSLEGP